MEQKKVKNPCLRLCNSCTSMFIKGNLFLTLKCKYVNKYIVALFWDLTQRRLVVSCRRFGTTVGCEILTAVLVKIRVIWDVAPCRLVTYLHLQSQQSKTKALRSTEMSVTPHQSTGRNLHQHLC